MNRYLCTLILQFQYHCKSQALVGDKDKKSDDDAFILTPAGEGDADSANQQQKLIKLGGNPKIKQLVFEMRVKNQVIYAHPNVSMMMQVSLYSTYSSLLG